MLQTRSNVKFEKQTGKANRDAGIACSYHQMFAAHQVRKSPRLILHEEIHSHALWQRSKNRLHFLGFARSWRSNRARMFTAHSWPYLHETWAMHRTPGWWARGLQASSDLKVLRKFTLNRQSGSKAKSMAEQILKIWSIDAEVTAS